MKNTTITLKKMGKELAMLKTLKLKRTCLALAVALPVFISGCSSKEETAAKYLNSGIEYYDKQQYEKARVELSNALQLDPKLAQAHYYQALLFESQGNIPKYYETLKKVEKLSPNDLDLKVTIAELLLGAQNFAAALSKAEAVLAIDPTHYNAIRVKAAALVGSESYEGAEELINQLTERQPDDLKLLGMKAVIARGREDMPLAISILDRAIALAEDKLEFVLLRMGMHQQIDDTDSVIQDLKILIEIDPAEQAYVFNLAKIYVQAGRQSDAEKLLLDYIAGNPENNKGKLVYLDVLAYSDKARAKSALDGFLKEEPGNMELRFYRVAYFQSVGKGDEAKADLVSIADDSASDNTSILRANAMLAQLFLLDGKVDEAKARLNKNLAIKKEHEATLLLNATISLNEKQYETAIGNLRIVLRNNPDSEAGYTLLGRAYYDSGSTELADDSYRRALDLNPGNLDAAIPVIQNLINNQDLERSDAILTRALQRTPNDVRLLSFLAQIKLMREDWQGTEKIASTIKNTDGGSAYSYFLSGRIFQGQERYDLAVEQYKLALDANPTMGAALQGLAASYVASDQKGPLVAYLKQYQAKNPKVLGSYVLAAEVHKRYGDYGSAAASVRKGLEQDPSWLPGYSALAAYLREDGKIDEAITVFEEAVNTNSESSFLKNSLAGLYERAERYEDAYRTYQRVLEGEPENLLTVNNMVALLVDKIPTEENLKTAVELAQKLKSSKQPYLQDTLGWALLKAGQTKEAEVYLRRAVEGAPEVAEIHYHMGVLLKTLGLEGEAKQSFDRASGLAGDNKVLIDKILQHSSGT